MKILIIGNKGFIGTYVAIYLGKLNGFTIWGCDVVIDYEASNYFLIDQSNIDFDDLFKNQNFDVCINCSGASSVPDSVKKPQRDFYLNTVNVFNLLEGIRKYQPECKFLNLSSAAVYGNPTKLPIKETAVCKPLSPYGFHKRNAELICEEFYQFYQIKTCNIRIFSAYGNGLKKQIFWDIAQKAKKLIPITLFGTGKESRDFIHVDDIIKAIELIIQKGSFEATYYNVASGIEVSIETAAKHLLNAIDWKGSVNFNNENRQGDPENWCADISKLKNLGFIPKVSIETGLSQYGKWVKE